MVTSWKDMQQTHFLNANNEFFIVQSISVDICKSLCS